MPKNINVRISDELVCKIENSGMKTSDYTRKALEFYSIRKENASLRYDIEIIDGCIDLLTDHRKMLEDKLVDESYKTIYNLEKNVKKNDEKSVYKSDENVKKIYNTDEMSLQFVKKNQDEIIYNSDENVKKMEQDPAYQQIEKYINTLSKMLNTHGFISKELKQKINDETTLTLKEISDFIVKFNDDIKNYDYYFDDEHIKSMPSSKKYKE